MEKSYSIVLDQITYGGDNIGDDFTFTLTPKGGTVSTFKKQIKSGATEKELKRVAFVGTSINDKEVITIELSVLERDPKFSDPGSGSVMVEIDLKGGKEQTTSVDVVVTAKGGDAPKKASLKLTFVSRMAKEVLHFKKRVTLDASSVVDCKAATVDDKGKAIAPEDQATPKKVADRKAKVNTYDGPTKFEIEYDIEVIDGIVNDAKSSVRFYTINFSSGGKLEPSDFTTPPCKVTNVKVGNGKVKTLDSFDVPSQKWYDPAPKHGGAAIYNDRMTATINLATKKAEYVAAYTLKTDKVDCIYTVKGDIK
jgi:hypothetical protein